MAGTAKTEDTLAPVKRDVRRLFRLPLRHTRAAAFVSLSLLVLALPLVCAWYRYKYDSPHVYQLRGATHHVERTSIRENLGKGKEVFTLLAEAVTDMPPGFYAFDRAITRIANDTHRLHRDLRGLVYLAGKPHETHPVSRVAATLEGHASSLKSRTLLLDDLLRIRALLDLIVQTDAGAGQAPDEVLDQGLDQEAIDATRGFLRPAEQARKPETDTGAVSVGESTETSGTAEDTASNTVAEIYRHFKWKRTELVELIEATLWPGQESKPDPEQVVPSVERCMSHALALQRMANWLSRVSWLVSLVLAGLVALFWYRMWVGRQYALGRSRWRALLVFYVFLVLQTYNVILVGAYQPDAGRLEEDTVSVKTASLKDAYKTATQEIYHRLEQEQHFYILKFTMIGALLAVFFRFLLSSGDEKDGSAANTEKPADGSRTGSKLRGPSTTG